jgi:hypothetical protein
MPRPPPSPDHGSTRVPKLSNFDLKFSCTVLTGDVIPPWVTKRRAFSEHGPFIRAVWRWLDIPLELCHEKRRTNFKNTRQQHNTLQTTLCFPLKFLQQGASDSECHETLSAMILGRGACGLGSQGITLRNRQKWFDQVTFEAIKDDLAARMIAVVRESYNATVLAEKASAEHDPAEGASNVGTGSVGPNAPTE